MKTIEAVSVMEFTLSEGQTLIIDESHTPFINGVKETEETKFYLIDGRIINLVDGMIIIQPLTFSPAELAAIINE